MLDTKTKERIQSYFWFHLRSFLSLLFHSKNYTRSRWMLDFSIFLSPFIKRLLTKQELIARLYFSRKHSITQKYPRSSSRNRLWIHIVRRTRNADSKAKRKLESSFDILMSSVALDVFSMDNECFYTLITSLIHVLQKMLFLLMFRRILKL